MPRQALGAVGRRVFRALRILELAGEAFTPLVLPRGHQIGLQTECGTGLAPGNMPSPEQLDNPRPKPVLFGSVFSGGGRPPFLI